MALTTVLTGGIADDAVTGAKIENDPTIAGILTTNGLANINLVSDTYRLLATATMSSGQNVITNWERDDAYNDGVPIGSGLSQSSGVFTFAETGIYFIIAKNVSHAADRVEELFSGKKWRFIHSSSFDIVYE